MLSAAWRRNLYLLVEFGCVMQVGPENLTRATQHEGMTDTEGMTDIQRCSNWVDSAHLDGEHPLCEL